MHPAASANNLAIQAAAGKPQLRTMWSIIGTISPRRLQTASDPSAGGGEGTAQLNESMPIFETAPVCKRRGCTNSIISRLQNTKNAKVVQQNLYGKA
jgi:hypothetical protein